MGCGASSAAEQQITKLGSDRARASTANVSSSASTLPRLVLTCTEDAARHVDFSDLVSAEGGCTIDDTALRAISLSQLERVILHLRRRLTSEREVWMVRDREKKNMKELTSPDTVTLYNLNTYCIKAATLAKQTSLVELMASSSQQPDYFVSQYVPLSRCKLLLTDEYAAGGVSHVCFSLNA